MIATSSVLIPVCGGGSIPGDTTTDAPVEGAPAVDLEVTQEVALAS